MHPQRVVWILTTSTSQHSRLCFSGPTGTPDCADVSPTITKALLHRHPIPVAHSFPEKAAKVPVSFSNDPVVLPCLPQATLSPPPSSSCVPKPASEVRANRSPQASPDRCYVYPSQTKVYVTIPSVEIRQEGCGIPGS